MKCIAHGRPRFLSYLLILLFGLLRIPLAHAQATSCLIYSFSDPHTPCTVQATSAYAAVAGVISCDGPLFCGTSTDTIDSIVDPAKAGQSFLATVTYNASQGCGASATGQAYGSITAATGPSCPATQYFAQAKPPQHSVCGACNAAGGPISAVADPVNPGTGDVFRTEQDVAVSGPGGCANQLLWGRQMSGFIDKAKQKCGCQQ